jgi:hypothetical protein
MDCESIEIMSGSFNAENPVLKQKVLEYVIVIYYYYK